MVITPKEIIKWLLDGTLDISNISIRTDSHGIEFLLTAQITHAKIVSMVSPGKEPKVLKVAKPKARPRYAPPTNVAEKNEPQMIPERWRLFDFQCGKCFKCAEDVAVMISKRTDRPYYTEVFMLRGRFFTGRLEFHSKYCGKPELHDEFQIRYGEEAEEEDEQ